MVISAAKKENGVTNEGRGGTSVEFCLTRVSARQPLVFLTFLSSLLGEPGHFRGALLGLHRVPWRGLHVPRE